MKIKTLLVYLILTSISYSKYRLWCPEFTKHDIKPTQEELSNFDQDEDGYLNSEERKKARKQLIEKYKK